MMMMMPGGGGKRAVPSSRVGWQLSRADVPEKTSLGRNNKKNVYTHSYIHIYRYTCIYTSGKGHQVSAHKHPTLEGEQIEEEK